MTVKVQCKYIVFRAHAEMKTHMQVISRQGESKCKEFRMICS